MKNDECDTDIRTELLRKWAIVARDQGVGVCNWLTHGANVGMSADPEGIHGIFSRADAESQEEFETEENVSFHSADDLDVDSLEQIKGHDKSR